MHHLPCLFETWFLQFEHFNFYICQIDARKVGIGQPRVGQIGSVEICTAKIRVLQVRMAQACSAQICFAKMSTA